MELLTTLFERKLEKIPENENNGNVLLGTLFVHFRENVVVARRRSPDAILDCFVNVVVICRAQNEKDGAIEVVKIEIWGIDARQMRKHFLHLFDVPVIFQPNELTREIVVRSEIE